jgi:endonuclease-3
MSIIRILSRTYPKPRSELNFSNEYELLVSVVLSAQCTDKKVNEVTPILFSKYPNAQALSKASISDLERIIKPINYYKTKAKNLSGLSKMLCSEFKGDIPRTFDELRRLPGVGQKTANVVLGELGAQKTFPVDTHVFRVSKRLGFASEKTREKVEEELKKRFDRRLWRKLHHWLILHGRRVCKAQNPRCKECKLAKFCPSYPIG